MIKLLYLFLTVALMLIARIASAACIGDPTAVVVRNVYIVPQLSPTQLYAAWAPVLERVGRQAKTCFDLQIPANIVDFEKAIFNGQADFAFMNPYHLVMAHRSQGYDPLVAEGKQLLDGILLVKADSPITSIGELKNKPIAFPAPNAFGASLLIRSIFSKSSIPIQPVYVKSHSNVYRAIIMGDVSAGGGINATYMRERPEVREQLKILYVTPGFRPHPFAAHPRIPSNLNKAITEAFISMKFDSGTRALLEGIQMPDPIPVSYKLDYQALESLGLEKFVVNHAN